MKILLVDDDTSIIQALLPALKSLPGHEVHVALSAEKAVERAPAVGGIDLLITDVVMDPMDGFTLREQLESWYPGLRTLFISGYDLSSYADRMNGTSLLNKPFGVEELLAKVQAVIEGRTAHLEAAPAAVVEEQAPEELAAPAAVVEPEPAPMATPEPVAVEEPVAYETPSAPAEETLDPVVHSAAPHGGSPSVPETEEAGDLYAGSFEAAPNIAAHAVMPVEEPLLPVHEPVAEPEPEPPAMPVPVAVPVARPVAMKPTTKTVSGIHPAPTVKAVARPATPVAAPKAVASPRATAVPGSVAAPKAVATGPQPTAAPTVRATASTPGAVPVARPAVAAAAVPVAKAVAATPTAVPVARPVAATPTAVPVVRPAAASPTATPVARPAAVTPGAVPVARPVATPSAKPVVATPSAVPVAKAVAAPVAKAVAAAVPVAKAAVPSAPGVPVARPAAPGATPKAVAAKPVASATARPPVPTIRAVAPPMQADLPPPPPPPKRESHSSSAYLIGQTIGGYNIVSQLGEGRWGSVFAAVQVSINRPVGLKLLSPDYAADEAQQARFTADARAKAHVQHPGILSVYEAGSADNWTFYTQEFVDGQNLEEMAATGRRIDEPTALKLLKTAADGLAYFAKNNIPHTPFQPSDIYLGADGQPRLSNLATQLADQPIVVGQEIESLGRAMLSVIDAGANVSTAMRALLGRTLRTHANPITDWAVLLQGVKALEPKIIPVEAAKISAQERAALATVAKARQEQKRSFLYNVVALISLMLLATGVVVYLIWFRTNERLLNEQVHIPAGEFLFGPDGKTAKTEEFWIDQYEVTIGQYANFVRFIDAHPGDEHQFDHPKQPKNLGHIPEYWTIYYSQARRGGAAHSVPITLNAPMLTVTWWDAYAYAKWMGRELPTEQEWEKAARGEKGLAFPWGDDADAKRANTNADYNERQPGAKAIVDGFNFWGDVDKQKKDKSPYGVIGMAGNVSEWVLNWEGDRFPVIKGGNFSMSLQQMSSRIVNRPPEDAQEFIGFRTVTHKAPEKK
ncbi:MAG TPA: SUMF1/EgtB/PvdO family nonheme iron enzyme [Chthoniobacteraceae bacterium]|jgi:formylglycine-generating enzyme required for sulfatase activity/CheY-like chemotaxis protein|nr:SUMF1/EgtB/PvdO family nonheme iron enzyme [Chthoniobacteraceae bacterium]